MAATKTARKKAGTRRAGTDLFRRHPKNPVLTAGMWPYPVNSVFNPAAARVNGTTVLLARVEDHTGVSHLTAARSRDGATGWKIDSSPTLAPDPERHPEELFGIEDPRATWLEERGQWAVAYTAVSRQGPLVSLAVTEDFKRFRRLGPVLRPSDKDAALFPRRFGGSWAMLHRPTIDPGGPAHIWISFSPDLRHWGGSRIVMEAREGTWWDAGKIGLCAQPLETPEGWLILYHGVKRTASGSLYRVGLALLDLDEPWRVLRRSAGWVMGPEAPYEREGDVEYVVFPCGWLHDASRGELRVYYGAADTRVAMATASMKEVLAYIKGCPAGEGGPE
ncbi:MAG: glycosidase [Elusimicrobiota bacterium]